MDRRTFLGYVATGCAPIVCSWRKEAQAAPASGKLPDSFLLSTVGCGRATGYAEANKIVTVGDRTHVAWLDSPPEGFRVRIRTLDRRTGTWSPTYTVGEAFDNHGGPALTVDGQGYLHIVYYPHHHPFRYRRSRRPNDASGWEEEIRFGQRCTYPTLVCGPDDTLYVTGRRSFPDRPWQVELWTKPPGGDWRGPVPILRSRYKGYAHFQESLCWGPASSGSGRTLHLCCRFHEKSDSQAYGRLQTVGYMVSRDFGRTWQRSDGSRIETPATAEEVEVLARGGVDRQRILRAGAMSVDSSGAAHLLYSVQENAQGRALLAVGKSQGGWRRVHLNRHLSPPWSSWELTMPGGVTFNRRGEMILCAMLQQV
ncbi:MAG: BNR-4 repeat-containing protein, partial [Planctomycetota bacterium]